MNPRDGITFLFTIAEELKRSFESPVILLTFKDYADIVFNSLVDIRNALLQNKGPQRIVEIITNFHFEWLQSVEDLQNLKSRIINTPRNMFDEAVDFTLCSIHKRYEHFKLYIDKLNLPLVKEQKYELQTELEIIKDMQNTVKVILLDKQNYLKNQADNAEYCMKLSSEIEEHLNWLDWLNDNLAIQCAKVIDLQLSELQSELSNTLKSIIDDATGPSDTDGKKIIKMYKTTKNLRSMIRLDATHNLEISKIVENIQNLDERIQKAKTENPLMVLALEHKKIYLKDRLNSLENLKTSLTALKEHKKKIIFSVDVEHYKEFRIFNHMIPSKERCRLVEQLIKVWETAVYGTKPCSKSIISILSVTDMNVLSLDTLGQFTVDKYGRKIYTKEGDKILYQVNEKNNLVPVSDDESHVYFYDDHGRYYLDDLNQHVYKAHNRACEYKFNSKDGLTIYKEHKDGILYAFDSLGKYYENEFGNHIYVQDNKQYKNDGFGNLIQIRDQEPDYYEYNCPPTRYPIIIEENKYLKHVIGKALIQCLAKVVLHQPSDPINYLAECLEQYRQCGENREKQLDEKEYMIELRKQHMATDKQEVSSENSIEDESQTTILDYNFLNCKTAAPGDY